MYKLAQDTNYNLITARVYEFPYESLFAFNSAFPITHDFEGYVVNNLYNYERKMKYVYLNVFPHINNTYILVSCFSNEFKIFKTIFSKLDKLINPKLEQVFSQLILVHCENIFLSPQKWNSLSNNKKREVINFLQKTLNPPEPKYLSMKPPINLFDLMKCEI